LHEIKEKMGSEGSKQEFHTLKIKYIEKRQNTYPVDFQKIPKKTKGKKVKPGVFRQKKE
jgi:hypothetical protein